MSKTRIRIFVLTLALSAATAMAQSPTDAMPPPDGLPDAADLLARIDHYRTIPPESEPWQRQQAQSSGTPRAALDLLLLDMFGPGAGTVPPEQTQARLRELMATTHAGWRKDSLQLLRLLADQLEQTARLKSESARLQDQLEQERGAHEETRKKLEAIRRIDQELESRGEEHGATGAR